MALESIAAAMGKPMSQIIAEILQQALPALQMTVEALAVVQKQPETAKALIDDYAARSINSLTQSQMDLAQRIRQKPGPKPKPKVKHG